MTISDKVRSIIVDAIDELGYELYDIEYEKQGIDWFLRVLVDSDKEGGIELDDLVKLNDLLCERITDDMMDREYILECSSPGAERKLRNEEEIKAYIGSYIYIKTYEKLDGEKEFYGDLVDFVDNKVQIKLANKKTKEIDYAKIANIRLAIKF